MGTDGILVYAEYAKTSNLFAVAIYLIMLVGGQTAQIGRFPKIPTFILSSPCGAPEAWAGV